MAQEKKCPSCDELISSKEKFCSERCKKEFLEKIAKRVTNWLKHAPGFNGA